MTLTILLQASNVGDIFNIGIMDAILRFKNDVALTYSEKNPLINVATLMCALFALIWCAVKLYPVIAGEEKLSVLPLLRPFAIAMILSFYPTFVNICMIPGRAVEAVAKDEFDTSWTEMRSNAKKRFQLMDNKSAVLTAKSIEVQRAENSERNDKMQSSDISKSSSSLSPLSSSIAKMSVVVMGHIKMFFYNIISYLALMFMNVVVCGVLLAQSAGLLIMVIIGPLSFAFSCLDPWKHSWSQWVARLISISLWSGLAYFVCFAAAEIMNSVLLWEIDALEKALTYDEWAYAVMASSLQGDDFMFPLMCLFVAFGMMVIFPVSTWIIQTTGGSAVIKPITAAVGVAAAGAVAVGTAGAGAPAVAGAVAGGGAAASNAT